MALNGFSSMHPKYLGKRLHNVVQNSLDQDKIIRLRRKVEDIKLQIIDAIENDRRPEPFDDVGWLNNLEWNDRDYHFIWEEFSQWLNSNGLTASFKARYKFGYGDEYSVYTMTINASRFAEFDRALEPDADSWYNNMIDRWHAEKPQSITSKIWDRISR